VTSRKLPPSSFTLWLHKQSSPYLTFLTAHSLLRQNRYYGPVHMDPVFHVTAITMRKDVLHQTVRHSGRYLSWTESANLGGRG
jgi:hypothetical protein